MSAFDVQASCIIVMAIAFASSLPSLYLSSRAIKRLGRTGLLSKLEREEREFKRLWKEARLGRVKRDKLLKARQRLMRTRLIVAREQLRHQLKSIVALLPLYMFIFCYFGGFWLFEGVFPVGTPVAYLPFEIPFIEIFPYLGARHRFGTELYFFGWYIICTLALSSVISRALGVRPYAAAGA